MSRSGLIPLRRNRAQAHRKRVHALRFETLEPLTLLSFMVTSTADSGPGSLTQAILDANANGGGTIDFDINGGGSQTINSAGLPAINAPITMDATSQPGYNGSPLIRLNANTAGTVGITVERGGSGSVIRGLNITGFTGGILLDGAANTLITNDTVAATQGTGIAISGSTASGNIVQASMVENNAGYGIDVSGGASGNIMRGDFISGNGAAGILLTDAGTSGNVVQGSMIGTDGSGSRPMNNASGDIYITNGSSRNTIGRPGSGNLISGSAGDGIDISGTGTSLNVVQGNFIGVNRFGTAAVPNQEGVNISGGASGNMIGGSAYGQGNLISGNLDNGVDIHDLGTSGNAVQGNRIGTNGGVTGAIPNRGNGVMVVNLASHNTVGGVALGAGNVIGFNLGNGIAVGQSNTEGTTGVAIRDNAIFANAQLGIDLGDDGVTPNSPGGPHSGPNLRQNFPIVTMVTTNGSATTVVGTLNSTPNTTFRIEFFGNDSWSSNGYGQGERMVGAILVTTDGNGNAGFHSTLPVGMAAGQVLSATATDPSSDTSEFSLGVAAIAAPQPSAAPRLSAASIAAPQPSASMTTPPPAVTNSPPPQTTVTVPPSSTPAAAQARARAAQLRQELIQRYEAQRAATLQKLEASRIRTASVHPTGPRPVR